jgi:hypothetical protein
VGEVLTLTGTAAQLSLATILLLAGFAKAVTPRDLRGVLAHLGAAEHLAGLAATAVIAAEVTAGVGLLVLPAQSWPRVLTLGLVAGFAGAGALAMARRERITCHCLGGLGRGAVLGRRQLTLLPAWLALVAVAQWRPPTWDRETGLLVVAAVLLALAALQVPRERRLRTPVAHARVALDVGMPATRTEGVR